MQARSALASHSQFLVVIGFLAIPIIGVIDYLTGYEYAFAVFYVIPITLITQHSNLKIGMLACAASAIAWFLAEKSTGHPYSNDYILYWNTLIRFSFFVIIAHLLHRLQSALDRETNLSLTDYLTGASNSRHFYAIVQMEIDRFERQRRPFTLAYLDVDNFKTINDTFGHAKGDLVLNTIVTLLKSRMRKTDLIARLGGDEFAILLSDTNQADAQIIFAKTRDFLSDEMTQRDWQVTFSIGVVTCVTPAVTADELIRTADALMYSAKHSGKNTVKYLVHGESIV